MQQRKKHLVSGAIITALLLSSAGVAFPVFPGKSIEYSGGGEGKVVFSGSNHRGRQKGCSDCHPDLFPMKKTDTMTMKDMMAGKSCGACHNGTEAFSVQECARCHRK